MISLSLKTLAEFLFKDRQRGPGYWKFNNLLLHNKEYVDAINSEIIRTSKLDAEIDLITRWEVFKDNITAISKDSAKKIKQSTEQEYNRVTKIIRDLENKHITTSVEYKIATMSLQNFIEAETAKCAFKAKAKWHK